MTKYKNKPNFKLTKEHKNILKSLEQHPLIKNTEYFLSSFSLLVVFEISNVILSEISKTKRNIYFSHGAVNIDSASRSFLLELENFKKQLDKLNLYWQEIELELGND